MFQDAFAAAFGAADEVIVAAVFRSSLPEAERLDADRLVADLRARNGRARHIPENDEIIATIVREHRDGDVVVLMSNGGFGGIHRKLIRALHDRLIGGRGVAGWYLCGPYDMVMNARATLADLGVDQDVIHDELFFAGPLDESSLPPEPPPGEGSVDLTVILDGRAVDTRMTPETSILDAALRVRSELPFSCKGGMCATCKGRIEEGEVRMDKNYALVDSEVEAGYVLTCQAHPVTDRVVVRYDHR